MRINLTEIKTAITNKCIGGIAVGIAAVIGMSPMTAFAQSREAESIIFCVLGGMSLYDSIKLISSTSVSSK